MSRQKLYLERRKNGLWVLPVTCVEESIVQMLIDDEFLERR